MEVVRGSKPSFTSCLNLFSMPETDISVTDSKFITIMPNTPVRDNTPDIIFHVPATQILENRYYDLGNSYLLTKLKVTKNDGSALAPSDDVAPANLMHYMAFKNCIVSVQGNIISNSNNMYSYRGILPEILAKSEGEKTSTMTAMLYYKDTTPEDFTSSNTGYVARKALAAGSKTFDVVGRLASSLFEQERWIIPGVTIDVQLTKNSSDFSLVSKVTTSNPYKFSFEECTLYLKVRTVNQDIVNKHKALLSKGTNSLYVLRDVDVRSANIPVGALSYVSESLFPSKIPGFLVLGIVSSKAFYGSLSKNAFNFGNYGVSSISVKCEENNLLYRSINVDYENDLYIQAYQNLISAIGQRNNGNFITREEFAKKGFCIYIFELLSSIDASQIYPEKRGLLKVN